MISPALPSTSVSITATITGPGLHHHHRGGHGGHAPTPRPTLAPAEMYCATQGTPLGAYFEGTFYVNKGNTPVTLEGCFQYCQIYARGGGCKSWNFREREGFPGSAACDLYGESLTDVLASREGSEDSVWYDIGCGSPSA